MTFGTLIMDKKWGAVALAVVVLAAILVLRSWHGRAARAAAANAAIAPVVAVARVEREDLFRQISIPAEFRPYTEVELHAKVSGYVKDMKVDIGDRVKAGQLLAVLEVPELTDDFDHAVASHRRAQADYRDAHLAYTRLIAVNKDHPNLIAQQDLDTAEARDATAEGAVAAARADVDKYRTMVAYTRITAPFGGVITKRYADPGSLIQAGTASNSQAMPLVRVSDNALLRLDFPVSVDYVRGIHLGASVGVSVDSLGGRVFSGKIKRFSDRIDDSTRTMVVEMEVPNPSLELVPGMYATVTLKFDERPQALAVPIEAVPAGARSVLVVNSAHQVEDRPVTLGLETPARYEVLRGLNEGDLVMIGNPAQLAPGQKVEPRVTAPLARE
ncbi:MAG: efflux RND transporter periplasmic adaptor subunit [Steroidobacteraceae bacterium]